MTKTTLPSPPTGSLTIKSAHRRRLVLATELIRDFANEAKLLAERILDELNGNGSAKVVDDAMRDLEVLRNYAATKRRARRGK